jgi:hypothetical protein
MRGCGNSHIPWSARTQFREERTALLTTDSVAYAGGAAEPITWRALGGGGPRFASFPVH